MPATTEDSPDVRQAALLAMLNAGLAHGEGEEDGLHGDGHADLADLAEWIADPANINAAMSQKFDEHEWEESKHKRGAGGRFGSGGGAGKKDAGKKETVKEASDWKTNQRKKSIKESDDDHGPVPDWADVTQGDKHSHLVGLARDPDRIKKERAKILGALKEAVGMVGKALSWVGKKTYDALPAKGKTVVDGAAALYGWLDHNILEKGKELTQRLAMQVAHERGLGDEHVLRVGEGCRTFDGIASWVANIPLAHEILHEVYHLDGWLGFGLAKIGFCMPTASLSYCVYSGFRAPLSMAKAASKTLLSMVPWLGYKTRAQQIYHNAGPKDKTTDDARRGKVHAHAESGPEPLVGKKLMGELLERMEDAGKGADWWYALFCGAFDLTHDSAFAMQAADEVFAKEPDGEDLADEVTPEEIAEWIDGYTPPVPDEQAAAHAEHWNSGKHWEHVASSNVDWVNYDSRENVLLVVYLNGKRYAYSHVSPDEADSMMNSDSKGTWLWDNVRVRGKGNSGKTRKPFGQFAEEWDDIDDGGELDLELFAEWEEEKHHRAEGGKFASGSGGAMAGHRDKVAGVRKSHQEGKDAVRASHREERTKIAGEHKEKRKAVTAKANEKISKEKTKGKKAVGAIKVKQQKLRDKIAAMKTETETNLATIKAAGEAVQHLAAHPEMEAYAASFPEAHRTTSAELLDPSKNLASDLIDIIEDCENESGVKIMTPDVRAKLKAGAKAEERNEQIEADTADHELDIADMDNDRDEAIASANEKIEAHREEAGEAHDALQGKYEDKHERAKEKAEKAHAGNHKKHAGQLEQVKDDHNERVASEWEKSDDHRKGLMDEDVGVSGQDEYPGGENYVAAIDDLRAALRATSHAHSSKLTPISPKELAALAQDVIREAESFHSQNKANPQADEDGFIDEANDVLANAKALAKACRRIHQLGNRDITEV